MSREITSRSKHAASGALSEHTLPAPSSEKEASTASLLEHVDNSNVSKPLQRRGQGLALGETVLKLLTEERPIANSR
jgi:hypothetical protein